MNRILILLCLFVFLEGCSSKPEKKRSLEQKLTDFSVGMFPNYKNQWFDAEGIYKVFDRKGATQKHMFFDPQPELDTVTKEINFIITTPVDSAVHYNLDIVSGLTYKGHRYCSQTDVWQVYDKPIDFPPYTQGIIPRVLDKLGKPQTILVFGEEGFYAGRIYHNTRRVKIVGGIVEQYCEMGHCTGANSWQTRLILVAIDPNDKRLAGVETIDQLKKFYDWDYVKAFRENGIGRNIVASSSFPAYRFGAPVRPRAAVNYIKRQAKTFTSKDLYKMRNSCHSLYDFIWEHIGKLPEKGNLKLSRRAIFKMRKKIETLKKDFKKKKRKYSKHKKYDFVNNFKAILESFGDHYQTCTDYVKPSNVNLGFRRHWFFTYFTAVMKLYQMGHYYNCKNMAWYYNPIDHKGVYLNDPAEKIVNCTNRQLNKGFSYAIPYLSTLKRSGSDYYRYLDYDNGAGGTHNKIYSWVRVQPQRLKCDKSLLEIYKNKKMEKGEFIFPSDIKWSLIGRPERKPKPKAKESADSKSK